MAIPLTGPTGVFTRLGAIGGIVAAVNAGRGTTVPGKLALVASGYAPGSPLLEDFSTVVADWQASQDDLLLYLQSLAAAAVVAAAQADAPLADPSLGPALQRLIAQMLASGDSVSARPVAATVAADGANVGNPAWVVAPTTDTGRSAETQFAETWRFACTADSQSRQAVAGGEPIAGRGLPAAASPLDPAWPAGSGAAAGLRAVDASQPSGSGGQVLAGGDFESWTVANVPDGWTVRVGVPGTDTLQSASEYTGASALALPGGGSVATALDQSFGANGVAPVLPATQYAFNLWASVTSVPAAGTLEAALVDGSGAVLLDAAGNPASVAVSLPTLSTTYAPVGGMLRTPRVLPALTRFRLRLSSPLSSGSTLLVDRAALARPTRLYAGGPRAAVFSGSTPMVAGDAWTLATSATPGTGGFALLFERLFAMRDLGLLLPSSGSPTIPDALIA